jgi:superfamily I DNA/RNA helicase
MGFASFHGFDKDTWKRSRRIDKFSVKFKGKEHYSVGYGTDKRSKPLENLELAYAISVHKSQGSEFDIVYAIIPKRKSALLSMELLYTAVTRAQKSWCCLSKRMFRHYLV